MDEALLADFDAVVKARGGTRSEVLRDLARAEVTRAQVKRHVPAVATLTLVYDHHVRDLSEKLTEMQHGLGEKVRSTLHVHLDHHHCLEVIVIRGFADEIHAAADRLLATRGVMHGGLEVYTDVRGKGAEEREAHTPHTHAPAKAATATKGRIPRAPRPPRA